MSEAPNPYEFVVKCIIAQGHAPMTDFEFKGRTFCYFIEDKSRETKALGQKVKRHEYHIHLRQELSKPSPIPEADRSPGAKSYYRIQETVYTRKLEPQDEFPGTFTAPVPRAWQKKPARGSRNAVAGPFY